jgi:hypothetical protein
MGRLYNSTSPEKRRVLMKRLLLILICLGMSAGVCTQQAAQKTSDPVENFEHLWKTFDEKYAIFDAKGVDWKALYRVYRPKASRAKSDDELFRILSDLLGHLNDNHVSLESKNPDRYYSAGYLYQRYYEAGIDTFRQRMAQRPVPESRFAKGLQERADGIFAFGWADEGVGYFHFRGFGNSEASRAAIDEIVRTFADARAVIIDVRHNGGGDDRVGKLIADRFADRKRLYMTTRVRKGAGYSDFEAAKEWYVEPDGPLQFTKTVLLLTDRTSISAAENFALAMKVLPHVIQVGDITSGCFADRAGETLPNGWSFSYSINLFLDHTGFCWEGIGVPPEIRQINTAEDRRLGKDRLFDLALELIKAGPLEPKKIRSLP